MATTSESGVKARMCVALLVGILFATWGLWVTANPAQAGTTDFQISADPTEGKPVTVTVSGRTEQDRYLWAFAFPEASNGCDRGTPREADHASGSTRLAYSRYIEAGDFQETSVFTPPKAGGYRLCSFVSSGPSQPPDAKGIKTLTVRRSKATSNVSVAESVQDSPVTVTVSGQTEVSRYLWVYAFPVAQPACGNGSTADEVEDVPGSVRLAYSRYLDAGSYQIAAEFTPPKVGPYRICSIIAEGRREPPHARTAKDFTVRAPRATSEIRVSPDPVAKLPITVTVSGQTETDRYLWVFAFPEATQGCGPLGISDDASVGRPDRLLEKRPIKAGSYGEAMPFAPSGAGSYRICSYVADDKFETVSVHASRTVNVREARAEITITPISSFRHRARGYALLEGVTELPGKIEVIMHPDNRECRSRPNVPWHKHVTRMPVEAGPIAAQKWWFIPIAPGVNRFCVYVTDQSGRRVTAMTSTKVKVKRNPQFLPRLITPNGKVGFRRPPVFKWIAGPGKDSFQMFASNPNRDARPIWMDQSKLSVHGARWVGHVSSVRYKARMAPGRYWWWIYRDDPNSGYREYSRPRSFVVKGPRPRNRALSRELRSANRGFPLWTDTVGPAIIPGIDSVSGESRVKFTKEHR